jgi:hypothetical protein
MLIVAIQHWYQKLVAPPHAVTMCPIERRLRIDGLHQCGLYALHNIWYYKGQPIVHGGVLMIISDEAFARFLQRFKPTSG